MVDNTVIEVKNISKEFGETMVFQNFHLNIQANERIHISGKNGLGKTTLLDILSGQILPDSGEINISGSDDISIGYVPYREVGLIPNFTGGENLKFFLNLLPKIYIMEEHPLIIEFLKLETFKKGMKTKFHLMSSGMKRLFLICCTLLHNPSIVLLDEPFQNLDQENRSFILNLIESHWKNCTVIIVDHSHHDMPKSFKKLDLGELMNA